MDPLFWLTVGKIGLDLWSGFTSKKAAEEGGEASRWAAYMNASDLRQFSDLNSSAILGAAGRNAQAYLTIGEANATAIERAVTRNLLLKGLEFAEEDRRHEYGQRELSSDIRAAVGAMGVQTNTGTPLHYLHAQTVEGIRQRRYMKIRHYQTLWTMSEEGKDRAAITRLTASENAAVIMSNAEAQSIVASADAERQAAAIERQGDLAYQTGQSTGQAALIGGISNAIGTGLQGMSMGAFGSWGNSNPTGSSLASDWRGMNMGWQNSTFSSGFMNPYPSYGSSLPAPRLTTNSGFSSLAGSDFLGGWK